jgi:hypothetical protein
MPNPSNTDIAHPCPQIGFKLLHNHRVETACDVGISDTKTTQSQRRIGEEKAMIQAQKSPLGYLDESVSPGKEAIYTLSVPNPQARASRRTAKGGDRGRERDKINLLNLYNLPFTELDSLFSWAEEITC